jgi:hypothetical protein
MAHTSIVNFPIHCQFLVAPVRWELTERTRTGIWVGPRFDRQTKARTFDPWQARAEFLRLPLDPNRPQSHHALAKLIGFLDTVGIWEQPSYVEMSDIYEKQYGVNVLDTGHVVYGQPRRDLSFFWETQGILEGLMDNKSHTFRDTYLKNKHPRNSKEAARIAERPDIFSLVFDWEKRAPRPTITTVCFWNAVLLSLQIDLVQGTRFKTCARPDCGIPYPISNRHEHKYCSQYCGHLESLRRKRGTTATTKKKGR